MDKEELLKFVDVLGFDRISSILTYLGFKHKSVKCKGCNLKIGVLPEEFEEDIANSLIIEFSERHAGKVLENDLKLFEQDWKSKGILKK